MLNDFLLIRKIKQGDDDAIDLLVRKYYKDILTYCYRHCFDRGYAEDLTQETFVRFFTRLSQYHYNGKTLNYLYTIAGNLCRDHLKKIKDIPIEETEPVVELFESDANEQVLNKMVVEQALEKLSEELREVLILCYFKGFKIRETADALQIGVPLAKYRLRKAKKQMADFLRKEEYHGSGKKAKDK